MAKISQRERTKLNLSALQTLLALQGGYRPLFKLLHLPCNVRNGGEREVEKFADIENVYAVILINHLVRCYLIAKNGKQYDCMCFDNTVFFTTCGKNKLKEDMLNFINFKENIPCALERKICTVFDIQSLQGVVFHNIQGAKWTLIPPVVSNEVIERPILKENTSQIINRALSAF